MARQRPGLARCFAVRLTLLACSLLVSRMVVNSDEGHAAMRSLQTALTEVIQTEMQARRARTEAAPAGPATAELDNGITLVPARSAVTDGRRGDGTVPENRVPVLRLVDGRVPESWRHDERSDPENR